MTKVRLSQTDTNQKLYKNNPDFSSNILIQALSPLNQNFICLYLPIYLRLDIIRFEQLAVMDEKAIMAAKILFDIDITNLPSQLVDKIINNMKWHLLYQQGQIWDFNDEESEDHRAVKPIGQFQVQGRTLLRYQTQNKFEARSITNIIWTPFQATDLIISVRVENILLQRRQNEQVINNLSKLPHPYWKDIHRSQGVSIRFNSMEYRFDLERVNNRGQLVGDMAQIMYNYDVTVGLYQLAQRLIVIQNTDKNFSEKQIQVAKEVIEDLEQSCWVNFFQCANPHPTKELRPFREQDQSQSDQLKFKANHSNSFNNIHFQIPLGRRPLVSIFQLMVPGYILGLISLVIFFQSPDQDGLADRVGSIATVILAYIALLPVIRSQIPSVPKLSIVEVVGYLEIMISVLCLIQSFIDTVSQQYLFVWYTDPFFMISLIIQTFATLVFLSAIATYYFKWLPMFSIKKGMRISFKPSQWYNPICDEWFEEKISGQQKRKIQKLY